MLETIPTQKVRVRVVRLASHQRDDNFLRELGLDEHQIRDMKILLVSRKSSDSLQALMHAPFNRKPQLAKSGHRPTRFSDGSFAVGYFSLEPETAKAEVQHWLRKEFAGKPTRERKAWYSRFTCEFDGSAKDLRPMRGEWPNLTHDRDYTFCNRLGSEANSTGLDGLLTPSVRKATGTNVPVFRKTVLTNPQEHSLVQVTCAGPNGTNRD